MNSNSGIAVGFLVIAILFFLGSFYYKFLYNFSEESVHTGNILLICSVVSVFMAMAFGASGKKLKSNDILNIIIICTLIICMILLNLNQQKINYQRISIFLILGCIIFITSQFLIE
jgi:MFS-type transporter involved in bile tolerance (Atg22 family)